MSTPVYHIPALLQESINGLNIKEDGTYVDVTFGGGGHSRAIMEQLGERGRLLGFDQDLDTLRNKLNDSRFTFVHSNFSFLKNFIRYYDIEAVDGILADLGVSFHHFDDAERGFSFRQDSALDMRMNRRASIDARTVLATYSEEELARLFLELVSPFVRRSQEKKELAQVFQALRIEVNHEIDVLKSLLEQSLEILKPGGRLVVITYHSLEDRLVKNFMRSGNVDGKIDKDFYGRVSTPWRLVNNKVIIASEAEVESNPRSRSAKLRIAEKLIKG